MARGRVASTDRAPERTKRIPVSGNRNILTVENQDPNYVGRWVNDIHGRIERFCQAGYEFVTKDGKSVGDRTVETADGTGSIISKDVGNGITAYYMQIRRDWYEEDQKAKQGLVDKSEESMKRMLNEQGDGSYGKVGFK